MVGRERRLRGLLYVLQSGRCIYCGEQMELEADPGMEAAAATFDHLRPSSGGGSDAAWNKALACRRCNMAKGDRSVREFAATVGRSL